MRIKYQSYETCIHHGVRRLLDQFESKAYIYLVLEWEEVQLQHKYKDEPGKAVTDEQLDRVSLRDYVLAGKYLQLNKIYVENKIKEIAGMIGETIEYLHNYGVIIRDLDLNQISLSQVAELHWPIIENIDMMVVQGPGEFTEDEIAFKDFELKAPEVIQGFPFTQKADCWSYGVIVYFMLT